MLALELLGELDIGNDKPNVILGLEYETGAEIAGNNPEEDFQRGEQGGLLEGNRVEFGEEINDERESIGDEHADNESEEQTAHGGERFSRHEPVGNDDGGGEPDGHEPDGQRGNGVDGHLGVTEPEGDDDHHEDEANDVQDHLSNSRGQRIRRIATRQRTSGRHMQF